MPAIAALRVMAKAHLGSPTAPVLHSSIAMTAAPAPPITVFSVTSPSCAPCPLTRPSDPMLNPMKPEMRINPPSPTSCNHHTNILIYSSQHFITVINLYYTLKGQTCVVYFRHCRRVKECKQVDYINLRNLF